jgi:hypothetical protein
VIPLLCIAITTAALYYVFHVPDLVLAGPEQTRGAFLRERKDAVYENLRDLNFEYRAGKVPDADFQAMKSSLEDEAAAILAELEQLQSPKHASEPARNKKG